VRFGLHVPQLGALAEPRELVDLAARAEAAGWDGFFLWDHLFWTGHPSACDPWVALGAIAATTERMVLGPIVTPLPRRRPWKLAREAMTLDRLAGGRTVLGVGIGTDRHREFVAFGEPATDDRIRAEMLDEGLEIITALWRGERVTVAGRHYTVDGVHFLPVPVQQPRVPIWCSVRWPNRTPLLRAARWDGIAPVGLLTSDDVAALAGEIARIRTATTPFDVVVRSVSTEGEAPAAYAAAGATWWLEAVEPEDDLDSVLARVEAGPPGRSR
jgi:alkanesulfonate monooxygenase SsuD/methylene tetrahydromethanopterin reductase-like flavin-dependent oxidoreductase (luciferase family)